MLAQYGKIPLLPMKTYRLEKRAACTITKSFCFINMEHLNWQTLCMYMSPNQNMNPLEIDFNIVELLDAIDFHSSKGKLLLLMV